MQQHEDAIHRCRNDTIFNDASETVVRRLGGADSGMSCMCKDEESGVGGLWRGVGKGGTTIVVEREPDQYSCARAEPDAGFRGRRSINLMPLLHLFA